MSEIDNNAVVGGTSPIAKIPLDFDITLTITTTCPECGEKYEKGTEHICSKLSKLQEASP